MSRRDVSKAQRDRAQIFAALGDRHRLMLVVRLSDGEPRSIVRLTADFRLTRQAVTKHLRVLEEAGIIESQRVGRENRFTYVPESIDAARSYLDTVSAQWDEALARLQAFVER